ncbi:hypothetical protein SCHPADRAFT_667486 [Schizopora paradoxa]|uniref:Uncharacterized protein n=1 Tax=Schizopora paradoxa TaxID=27342 RepID=A0A0H2RQF4_9AGAM|nr:hypothetical protein SCHPADRAFT_667486 [Schizopora paradoxa]
MCQPSPPESIRRGENPAGSAEFSCLRPPVICLLRHGRLAFCHIPSPYAFTLAPRCLLARHARILPLFAFSSSRHTLHLSTHCSSSSTSIPSTLRSTHSSRRDSYPSSFGWPSSSPSTPRWRLTQATPYLGATFQAD